MNCYATKEVGLLLCTRGCFNGTVLIVEVLTKSCKARPKYAIFRLVKSLYQAPTRTVQCSVIIASYRLGACLIKTLKESKCRTLLMCTLHDLLKTFTIKTIPLKHQWVHFIIVANTRKETTQNEHKTEKCTSVTY